MYLLAIDPGYGHTGVSLSEIEDEGIRILKLKDYTKVGSSRANSIKLFDKIKGDILKGIKTKDVKIIIELVPDRDFGKHNVTVSLIKTLHITLWLAILFELDGYDTYYIPSTDWNKRSRAWGRDKNLEEDETLFQHRTYDGRNLDDKTKSKFFKFCFPYIRRSNNHTRDASLLAQYFNDKQNK